MLTSQGNLFKKSNCNIMFVIMKIAIRLCVKFLRRVEHSSTSVCFGSPAAPTDWPHSSDFEVSKHSLTHQHYQVASWVMKEQVFIGARSILRTTK